PSRCTASGTRTPIPRCAFARYDWGMDDPEQPRQDKYVETARDRRIANALLLFFLIVVVGGRIWLAIAMFEQRRLSDCLRPGARAAARRRSTRGSDRRGQARGNFGPRAHFA